MAVVLDVKHCLVIGCNLAVVIDVRGCLECLVIACYVAFVIDVTDMIDRLMIVCHLAVLIDRKDSHVSVERLSLDWQQAVMRLTIA